MTWTLDDVMYAPLVFSIEEGGWKKLDGKTKKKPEVDRDALLALADEIEDAGYNAWIYDGTYDQDVIARRIREACGVRS